MFLLHPWSLSFDVKIMCELELVELIEEISVYSKVANNKWLLNIDKIDLDFSCKLYRFDGPGKSSIFSNEQKPAAL